MIQILNTGVGNFKSIKNMISKVGYQSEIISDHSQLKHKNIFIIPGVGNFSNVMNNFKKNFDLSLLKRDIDKFNIPVLGICVGMQIMGTFSSEGNCKGLSWIDFNVKKIEIDENEFPLPHMGWNSVEQVTKNSFFNNSSQRFYFAHSYHCDLKDEKLILNKVLYGEKKLVSSFQSKSITGVQFHPEKSHKYGELFFTNYLKNYMS